MYMYIFVAGSLSRPSPFMLNWGVVARAPLHLKGAKDFPQWPYCVGEHLLIGELKGIRCIRVLVQVPKSSDGFSDVSSVVILIEFEDRVGLVPEHNQTHVIMELAYLKKKTTLAIVYNNINYSS